MNIRMTGLVLASSLAATAGALAGGIDVFKTGFEAPAYQPGLLDGQDSWTVWTSYGQPEAVTVQAKAPHKDAQSVLIDPTVLELQDYVSCSRVIDYTVAPGGVVQVEWDQYQTWANDLTGKVGVTAYAGNGAFISSLYVFGWFTDEVAFTMLVDPIPTGYSATRGEWHHFRMDLDYGTRKSTFYCDDQYLAGPHLWRHTTDDKFGTISVIADWTGRDLSMIDNISIMVPGSCAADFDGNGSLDIFDFLGFQNAFVAMDPSADFNGDGVFDLFDFLGFVNAFNAGC